MKWKKHSLSQLNIGDSCYIVISCQTREVRKVLLPLGISKSKIRVINGGSGSPIVLEYNNQEIVLSWEISKLIEVKIDDTPI